ncbi:hypothetical protein Tco_0660087 [Tanacetum coccineum]
MADHSHNCYDEATTRESINDSSDNVDTKKLKENIHAIQVSQKICEGAHPTNDCHLTKEDKAVEQSNQDDPQDSSVQGLVTPSSTRVNASGEEQVEDISPNTLEAAKTLSKVASLKTRSIDKGRRYKRRKEAKGKKVVSSLDFQEEVDAGAEQVNTAGAEQVNTASAEQVNTASAEQVNTASAEQVSTAEGVNTGSIKLSTGDEKLSTGDEQVSTAGAKKSTSDQDKGQREGKAPMISEETPKKSKEQVLQEEASLAEAIRLDTQQREEVAKQVHLDSLLAQRIAEEEELNEQQKKRKAQVQFEAQHYTNEDWDLIRAKLEANAELSKSMLGSELQGEDFAKKMVDLVNQRKKYFAEERARAKRNKPMTQSQLKTYMMNYLKNQGTWKLSQLKSLSFEEIKKEFDKLVKQVESFAPISFEATKASLKRFGEELQTKTPKRMKDDEAKEDEPTKKTGKRRKQMARKGLHTSVDKDDSEDSDEVDEQEESVTGTKTPINPVPVAMKTPSIATYKIIKQGEKGVYQIVREDGTDIVYINFGAMMKSISRDDITELYRIVMNKYGMNGPEDELERVFWKYLKGMFEEPLSTDPIWSEVGQQKIISWRYYESCRVHCLNLESMDVYMLIERTYPLSAEMCKAMLDKKLQGGKPDENCYKMLKMMEKQAELDMVFNPPWNLPFLGAKNCLAPEKNGYQLKWFSVNMGTYTFLVASGLTTPELMLNGIPKQTHHKAGGVENLVETCSSSLSDSYSSIIGASDQTLALKNELRKLKGKSVIACRESVNKPKVIARIVHKVDLEPLSQKLKNNREAHEDYIRITKENDDTLRDIVKQARTSNPLDNALAYALPSTNEKCSTNASRSKPRSDTKNNKIMQPLSSNQKYQKVEAHTRNAKPSLTKEDSESKSMCLICNKCYFDARHDFYVVQHLSEVNDRARAKAVKSIKMKEWKL